MNKELIYKNACILVKEAKDKDRLTTGQRVGIGAGALLAPIVAVHYTQKKPKLSPKITEAAKKGVTFVETKGTPMTNFNKKINRVLPGYKTLTIPDTLEEGPTKIHGLAILQDPLQKPYIKADAYINLNKKIDQFDDKFKEQNLLKKINPKYSIPSANISNILNHPTLTSIQKGKAIQQVAKKQGIVNFLIKDRFGENSKGKFLTSKDLLGFIKKHGALASKPLSIVKLLAKKALSRSTRRDYMIQEKIPLIKNLEYRVHTVDDQVIGSLVSPRWGAKTILLDPTLAHRRTATKHVQSFLNNFYKKNPTIKKQPMQFAFDIAFTTKHKPVIIETNPGGMSGYLLKGRKRSDLARVLKGKSSLHKTIRLGIPLGIGSATATTLVTKDNSKK